MWVPGTVKDSAPTTVLHTARHRRSFRGEFILIHHLAFYPSIRQYILIHHLAFYPSIRQYILIHHLAFYPSIRQYIRIHHLAFYPSFRQYILIHHLAFYPSIRQYIDLNINMSFILFLSVFVDPSIFSNYKLSIMFSWVFIINQS